MGQFAREFFDALAARRPGAAVVIEVTDDTGKVQTITLQRGDTFTLVHDFTYKGGTVDIKVERKSIVKVMNING